MPQAVEELRPEYARSMLQLELKRLSGDRLDLVEGLQEVQRCFDLVGARAERAHAHRAESVEVQSCSTGAECIGADGGRHCRRELVDVEVDNAEQAEVNHDAGYERQRLVEVVRHAARGGLACGSGIDSRIENPNG